MQQSGRVWSSESATNTSSAALDRVGLSCFIVSLRGCGCGCGCDFGRYCRLRFTLRIEILRVFGKREKGNRCCARNYISLEMDRAMDEDEDEEDDETAPIATPTTSPKTGSVNPKQQ